MEKGFEITLNYVNPKCAGAEIVIEGEDELRYNVRFDNEHAARLLYAKLKLIFEPRPKQAQN